MIPFFMSIPHSGEKVPPEATWLKGLPEKILMCDVDRYVDQIYQDCIQELEIPVVTTDWHRYVVDLNRFPEDIDKGTVDDSKNEAGKFSRGFHWAITTKKEVLMPRPISRQSHDDFVKKYYEPFHKNILNQVTVLRKKGFKDFYHIDAHSMPSLGTSEHKDPGEQRADFVISDVKGTSCSPEFKDLVMAAYSQSGFKVAYNWPYVGGRITEMYGNPKSGHHTIQVEMNRKLYMDEETKKIIPSKALEMRKKLVPILSRIKNGLPK